MKTEAEIGIETVQSLIDEMSLGRAVKVESSMTPRGKKKVELEGNGNRVVLDQGGLTLLGDSEKQVPHLLKVLGRLLESDAPQSATTQDLMRRETYEKSSLSEVSQVNIQIGNRRLNSTMLFPDEVIPCTYGSTGGLNMAELLETMICADTAESRGIRPVETVFSMTGGDEIRANHILAQSTTVIPESRRADFHDFNRNLASRGSDQIRAAAEMLMSRGGGNRSVNIVESDVIMHGLGPDFTYGKLLLLSRLAGGDPGLFDERKTSWEITRARRDNARQAVVDVLPFDRPDAIRGIVYYARDTVLAGDYPGYVLMPVKVTSHANIYKLLEGYGALASQRAARGEDGGAILCPIQKHRIQIRAQIGGGDPCDVRVLAYLAERSPDGYRGLLQDFEGHCRVMSPREVTTFPSSDKRFIVENYFEI